MTEMSPLGTISGVKAALSGRSREQILATKCKQGRPHCLVDMRIVDDAGRTLPHDGKAVGNLQVRPAGGGKVKSKRFFKRFGFKAGICCPIEEGGGRFQNLDGPSLRL